MAITPAIPGWSIHGTALRKTIILYPAKLDKATYDAMLYVLIPEPDSKFESTSGWIIRDGTYYAVEYYQHPAMARRILLHVEGIAEKDLPDDCQLAGENRGWVRIQKSAIGNEVGFLLGSIRKPTNRQIDAIHDYCTKHNVRFPAYLID